MGGLAEPGTRIRSNLSDGQIMETQAPEEIRCIIRQVIESAQLAHMAAAFVMMFALALATVAVRVWYAAAMRGEEGPA